MKSLRISLAIFLSSFLLNGYAQQYYNEWIDYNLEYYKFKVVQNGIYRIPYDVLRSGGMDSLDMIGRDMKMFHNGQEVTIYVSTEELLGVNDYVEFYGEKNDGKPDTKMYAQPQDQIHTFVCLFTDISTYFLALSPNTVNNHFAQMENSINNPPPKEEFYYHTVREVLEGGFCFGLFPQGYDYLTDSQFDPGEGLTGGLGVGPVSFTRNLYTSFPYAGLGAEKPRFNCYMVCDNSFTGHEIETKIGNSVYTATSPGYGPLRYGFDLNIDDVKYFGTIVNYSLKIPGEWDRLCMNEIIYPRLFNFDNLTKWKFGVEKSEEIYLEINGFNASNTTPILYDFENKERYLGIVEPGFICKFQMKAAVNKRNNLYLSSQLATDMFSVTKVEKIKMENPVLSDREGDYLIIGSKRLIASTNGNNYLQDYSDYRSSPEGGSYHAQLFYIEDIEDQFGYGIRNHSIAIQNFVNYALDNFDRKPRLVFLVGKGIPYSSCRYNATKFNACLVPTWCDFPSDYFLVGRSASNPIPQVGIGRLSARKGDDVGIYLQKVRETEANKNDTIPSSMTPENREWVKRVMHMGGGTNQFEQTLFRQYLANYEQMIEGPLYGGQVTNFFKTSTDPVQIASSKLVDSLINGGISLITFFGHATTTTIDFNLEPTKMNNRGRNFVMLTNGCFVGSIFSSSGSVSEDFVFAQDKAAVGYIAPVNLGFTSSLNKFSTGFYQGIAQNNYDEEIGIAIKNAVAPYMTSSNYVDRMTCHQMSVHLDPALKLAQFAKPDYYIEPSYIKINPDVISTSVDSFEVKVKVRNFGRAINAEYTINIERIFPDGTFESYSRRVPATLNFDSTSIFVITDRTKGAGLNKFTLKVDYNNEIQEYSEENNKVSFDLFIYGNDIVPIYPYEYCIVNQIDSDFKLKFSTGNPSSPQQQFVLQMDTTALFNSPILQQKTVNSPGGLIEWRPDLSTLLPGKVYYWRGSLDTIYGNPYNWNVSSFLYDPSLSPGWNQSHYFQYLNNQFFTLQLPENREFKYPDNFRSVKVRNGIIYDQLIEAFFDGLLIGRNAFNRQGYMLFVYDTKSGKPIESQQIGTTGFGPFGDVTRTPVVKQIIEFDCYDANGRKSLINFLNNSIPDESYVLGYSFYNAWYSLWGNDSISLGTNLFQAFEELGVSQIRSVEENHPFVFFVQKGNPSFPQQAQIEVNSDQTIDTSFFFPGTWTYGNMRSVKIGPSKLWKDLVYQTSPLEVNSFDQSSVDVSAIGNDGTPFLLFNNLQEGTTNLNLDGDIYPYIQLEWETRDDTSGTPPQLDYWRVINDKVPEAVMNPQIVFSQSADTIYRGETFNCKVALENITDVDMDSMLVHFTIRDGNNNIVEEILRYEPVDANKHIVIDFTYDFKNSANYGLNSILVEANPNNDQVEQYHFNNFAVFFVYVSRDNENPLLDITFDGRHIIDGEIVSPKPEILIKLKDENQYLALNDSTAFKIFLTYPSNPETHVEINMNQPEIRFVPADLTASGGKNEARVYFNPNLLEDGTYKLEVQGADRSNNDAGYYQYSVDFKVDHKPSVSNFLNYPNPFSTSTRFVFTLTGEEVPDDIRIRIMSVSGKVVREFTREDLGNLHIGTNITEFTWDGTDTYGDRLANGLYFYKVDVKSNGKKLDHYETGADEFTDKGWGKMYIIR